jgi:hypothetical protein
VFRSQLRWLSNDAVGTPDPVVHEAGKLYGFRRESILNR